MTHLSLNFFLLFQSFHSLAPLLNNMAFIYNKELGIYVTYQTYPSLCSSCLSQWVDI